MNDALIGYSGFVGQNILSKHSFKHLYNSRNIEQIKNQKFDLVVSCATPSLVWKANLDPKSDLANIQSLMKNLKNVKAKHFVLISTIFVYPNPFEVDEDSQIKPRFLTPYGKHRYLLEKFVKKYFKSYTIIRLPNLFGQGIKKNLVYDLIYNNRLDLTDHRSEMQWYNLEHIWHDIKIAMNNHLNVVNFAVEPVTAKKIAKFCLDMNFETVTQKPPLKHKMYTKYGDFYGKKSPYLYDAKTTLKSLKKFIQQML